MANVEMIDVQYIGSGTRQVRILGVAHLVKTGDIVSAPLQEIKDVADNLHGNWKIVGTIPPDEEIVEELPKAHMPLPDTVAAVDARLDGVESNEAEAVPEEAVATEVTQDEQEGE